LCQIIQQRSEVDNNKERETKDKRERQKERKPEMVKEVDKPKQSIEN
jgi:hypothetical protein